MSGGHFSYEQYKINEIADQVEQLILNNSEYEWRDYSSETLSEFKHGLKLLRQAAVYAQRIDWLVSGDDGEESFHKRLKEDLACIGCCSEISESKCHSCGTMSLVQITEETQ